jgi:hypothetical protein
MVLAAVAGLWAGSIAAATVYTGDKIQGYPVISQLDVADLEPGKRVLLVAGVHGDELNPIAAVQESMTALEPAQMSGTVWSRLAFPR